MILKQQLLKTVLNKKIALTAVFLFITHSVLAAPCPTEPLALDANASVGQTRTYISTLHEVLSCKKKQLSQVREQHKRLVTRAKDQVIDKIAKELDPKMAAYLSEQWHLEVIKDITLAYQKAINPEKGRYIQLMKTFVNQYKPSLKAYQQQLVSLGQSAKKASRLAGFYAQINHLELVEIKKANQFLLDVSSLAETLTRIHNAQMLPFNQFNSFMKKHKLPQPKEVTKVMLPSLKRVRAYVKQRKRNVKKTARDLAGFIRGRERQMMHQRLAAEQRETLRREQILQASISFAKHMQNLIKKVWVEPKVNAYGFELPLLNERYHHIQMLLSFEPLCQAGKGGVNFWMGQGCKYAEPEFKKAHNYLNMLPMLAKNYVLILSQYNPQQGPLVARIQDQLRRENMGTALADYDLFLRLGVKK